MMVISRLEECNILLCSTAGKRITFFGPALFSALFQCLIGAGACDLAMNLHSYELAVMELGSYCKIIPRITNITLHSDIPFEVFTVNNLFSFTFNTSYKKKNIFLPNLNKNNNCILIINKTVT